MPKAGNSTDSGCLPTPGILVTRTNDFDCIASGAWIGCLIDVLSSIMHCVAVCFIIRLRPVF